MRKKIALIGSTGSIGRQVINVALRYPERFEIVAMAANTDDIAFSRQISAVRPAFACMRDEAAAKRVQAPQGTLVKGGEAAFSEACGYAEADVVFNAVTGFAGLKVALDAIAAGKRLALANKESLVVGGALVMPAAKAKGTEIVPVDSEHSAIWQCLHFDRAAKFSKLILTASGGALRDVPLERLPFVTAKEALAHPNCAAPRATSCRSRSARAYRGSEFCAHRTAGLAPVSGSGRSFRRWCSCSCARQAAAPE